MNEERFAKEMNKVQSVIRKALQKANALAALADGGTMSREKLQLTLEETAYFFEAATLYLRALCETQMPGAGGYGRRDGLAFQLPSGHIEIAGAGWVHMQIDTLLPHCRYMPATWLTDTVRQLLTAYMQRTNFRLHFKQMLLVIDEHSDVDGRHVFDQDNKGWKAISNALKGLVIWFSGYKYTHDPRGFDILPDGTHGTSGFLTEKEMREFLELSPAGKTEGMILGKVKKHPDDPDAYALYAAHRMVAGDNNNLLCIGAPGSGKSRGFIIPFLMGCAKRGESAFITDAKGELFERLSPYFRQHGFYVKAVNFLDMEHSDGWNCLYGLDTQPQLVQTVANTIVQNTSGPKEANDFWSRAELNLLMTLIHYVVNLRDADGNLLPIEQRGLGDVYRMIATESIEEINRKLEALPPEHPAKYPHGLFLKAKENLWGNIVIGLGNRLAVFQSRLVDKITRNHDVDLLLPGKQPCVYFVIISAQDSAYRFLSSLFFSLALPQLSNFARLQCAGGRLPVLTNFCLDEYCNIGYLDGVADSLNSIRGFNMSAQIVVQSLSQWQEKYPGKEWENQLATFDQTLYMGCNDLTSAKYISEKCGKVTISVLNNQMPMMPLFSPVYSSTRPYSQTRSNTQRDLMNPDEVLRLENRKCLALFKGHKPALLYKMTPEELPDYAGLTTCRVIDYIPEWRRKESEAPPQKQTQSPTHDKPPAAPMPPKEKQPDRSEQTPACDLAAEDELGMVECTVDTIRGL